MSARSDRVPVRAGLNMPLIRHRLAALGLVDRQLRTVIGTDLYALGRDPDARSVSLTMLVRLARLLDLALDDLVVTDDPHVHPGALDAVGDPAELGDDALLLGLIATFNSLHVLRVLGLLRWSRPRLDAALAVIGEQLAPTALRVVVTDERLTLMLRPQVIPELVRTQFEHEHRADYPLDPKTAVAVLELVREKILRPFPENPEQAPHNRPQSFNAAYLVGARLAVPTGAPVAEHTDDEDDEYGRIGEVEIHPDVLFALGLADAPAENIPAPDPRSAVTPWKET